MPVLERESDGWVGTGWVFSLWGIPAHSPEQQEDLKHIPLCRLVLFFFPVTCTLQKVASRVSQRPQKAISLGSAKHNQAQQSSPILGSDEMSLRRREACGIGICLQARLHQL